MELDGEGRPAWRALATYCGGWFHFFFFALCTEQKVKANPRSKVYRGEREYGERRGMTTEAGKIRVKIAPDGQYLSISGAEVVPILKKVAEKHGRYV